MSLEDAAKGYKLFDKKEEDCRKVILTPGNNTIVVPDDATEALVGGVRAM